MKEVVPAGEYSGDIIVVVVNTMGAADVVKTFHSMSDQEVRHGAINEGHIKPS